MSTGNLLERIVGAVETFANAADKIANNLTVTLGPSSGQPKLKTTTPASEEEETQDYDADVEENFVDDTPEPEPEPKPEPAKAEKPKKTKSAEAPSLDATVKALQSFMEVEGRDAAVALLKKFDGVTRVSEIPEGRRQEFIDACGIGE